MLSELIALALGAALGVLLTRWALGALLDDMQRRLTEAQREYAHARLRLCRVELIAEDYERPEHAHTMGNVGSFAAELRAALR